MRISGCGVAAEAVVVVVSVPLFVFWVGGGSI